MSGNIQSNKYWRMLIVILAFLSVASISSCSQRPTNLRFVTPSSSIGEDIVHDLVQLLDQESAITIELTNSLMTEAQALDALVAGKADVALVSNNMPYRKGIMTVMPLYATVLHIGYRVEPRGDTGIGPLEGAKIYAGPEGSASRLMFERVSKRRGLTSSDFSYISDTDENPDIVIVFEPISPDQFAKFPGYRLSTLGQRNGSGSRVGAAVLLNPTLRPFVIPAGTYGSATPEDVHTVAVDMMLVAREGLDRSTVYDLIREMHRLRPALSAQRPGLFQTLSDDFDTGRSTFVLHPGTLAYLQREAPSIYERYSGIAEVAVTLLIAFASAVFAGIKIYHTRRKNRIDVFYSETLRLRKSVNEKSSSDEKADVVEQVRNLQDTAFDMLVAEKLAADESFRIFITLSNDTLRQLGERS